jgi:hypothetical protein
MAKDNFDKAYREYLRGVKKYWETLDVEAVDVRNMPPTMVALISPSICPTTTTPRPQPAPAKKRKPRKR